jgi:hypothetical protein
VLSLRCQCLLQRSFAAKPPKNAKRDATRILGFKLVDATRI